jgi:hypothetical protein
VVQAVQTVAQVQQVLHKLQEQVELVEPQVQQEQLANQVIARPQVLVVLQVQTVAQELLVNQD